MALLSAQRRSVTPMVYIYLLFVGFICSFSPQTSAFLTPNTRRNQPLFAKKKKNRKTKGSSTSGFGGAAAEPCPCGSGLGYMKCCGRLHKEPSTYYADATAEQVVRSRYSAYAKREIDFIIASTHPENKDFMSDIEHWRKTIAANCYDNFELTRCNILDESYQGEGESEVATVQFVADMIQVDSRKRTSFMETSTFERGGEHGAWLYLAGEVASPPDVARDQD